MSVIRLGDYPTRAENQFGDGTVAVLDGVPVNPNGVFQVSIDPGGGRGGVKIRPADQFDSSGPGGLEASRVPAIARLKRKHPLVESRKRLAFGQPHRQADSGQLAGVLEFIYVSRDIGIALTVQRCWAESEGQLAAVTA